MKAKKVVKKQQQTGRGATRKPDSSRVHIPWARMLKRLFFLVLIVAPVIGAYQLWPVALAKLDRPVAKVAVEGNFQYVSKEEVSRLIMAELTGSFFDLDLAQLQRSISAEPWIQQVAISRQWPNRLKVIVHEQVPIARWGDEAFVNQSGEIFIGETNTSLNQLPQLNGQDNQSVQLMAQYQRLTKMLRPENIEIISLSCDEKLAWQARLNNGLTLYIGRDNVAEKMRRFIGVLNGPLQQKVEGIAAVDMRYNNGVAVRWKVKPPAVDVASRL